MIFSLWNKENLGLTIILIALSAGLFTIDIFVPLGVAGGVPYIAVILLSLRYSNGRGTIYMGLACIVLTIAGYFISPLGSILWMVVINRALAIAAIAITVYLGIKLKDNQERVKKIANLPEENPNPIMRISLDYIIKYANQSASKIFQYKKNEQISESMSKGWIDAIRNANQTRKLVEIEYTQNKITFSLKFTPVPDMEYINVYGIDISDRKKQELQLQKLTKLDELTGISNRRHFNTVVGMEWKRAKRFQNSISLVMVDIDYFKKYNDAYGHQAGDTALVKVAKVTEKMSNRPADLASRYGGEEFVVLLPLTDHEGAWHFAESLRKAIEDLKIKHEKSATSRFVTISAGVASVVPSKDVTYQDLIYTADKALYRAKKNGRNTVEFQKIIKRLPRH
ncbi:MAG: GGDEF domain-containing protein [Leptospirales bacterium]